MTPCKQHSFDSLIFDMDGTLWDAVDSYVKVWDATFDAMGLPHTVNRENLITCMGMPIDKIYEKLVGLPEVREAFLKRLDADENSMMPRLGGRLFAGVAEKIPLLAQRYRLFMVSNCGAEGLHGFLSFTKLTPCFEDTLTFGETGLAKEGNIRMLMERHGLKAPVYIGDTAGDCRSSHAAGIPFMHAAYGFGTAPEADFSSASFDEVADFFLTPFSDDCQTIHTNE